MNKKPYYDYSPKNERSKVDYSSDYINSKKEKFLPDKSPLRNSKDKKSKSTPASKSKDDKKKNQDRDNKISKLQLDPRKMSYDPETLTRLYKESRIKEELV